MYTETSYTENNKEQKPNHFSGIALLVYTIGLVLICLLGLLFGYGGAMNTRAVLNNTATYNQKVSLYEKTEFDFQLPNPDDEHNIASFNEETSIEKIFVYYTDSVTVSLGNSSYETTAIFSDDIVNYSISQYNDNRLIEGEIKLDGNSVVLDTSIADEINAKLNDEISVNFGEVSLQFSVAGISEDNTLLDNRSLYFALVGDNATLIQDSLTLKYAGAQIVSNDLTATATFLESYIPYGRLLARDSEECASWTDREYELYYERFMSYSYSSEIFSKAAEYETVLEGNSYLVEDQTSSFYKASFSMGAVYGAISLFVCVIVLAVSKLVNRTTNVRDGFYRAEMIAFGIISFLASGIIAVIAFNSTGNGLLAGFTPALTNLAGSYLLPGILGFGLLALAGMILSSLLFAVAAFKTKLLRTNHG